jgi:Pup amidohydrolase
MRDAIMGSETEYGLVPRKGNDDELLLGFLGACLDQWCLGGISPSVVQNIEPCVNWWKEDLNEKESVDTKNDIADAIRRMGMSGRYLENSARFYVDCYHPEYSTPECLTPWEVIAHEYAGERIVSGVVESIRQKYGLCVDLLKRTADYRGASYACHENYMTSADLFRKLTRETGWRCNFETYANREQAVWTMHLVSRQIFTGSGSIVSGMAWPKCFRLSQRQPFVRYFIAHDTVTKRSIINMRYRPYADPSRFGRLHVICGDANRTHWSNALKYGTSRLLLAALEDGVMPGGYSKFFSLKDPVEAFGSVARAASIVYAEAGAITAIDAQRLLLGFVRKWYAEKSDGAYQWAPRLLDQWEEVLGLLERGDTGRLSSMLDYFLKQRMFEEYFSKNPTKPASNARKLEFRYHLIGKDSLFDALCDAGWVDALVSNEEIETAMRTPPPTRAAARNALMKKFDGTLWSTWHAACFLKDGAPMYCEMPDPRSREYLAGIKHRGY